MARFDGEMSELLSARHLDRESKAAVEARSLRNLAQCESAMVDLLLAHDAEAEVETRLDPNIAYIDVVPVSTSWFGGKMFLRGVVAEDNSVHRAFHFAFLLEKFSPSCPQGVNLISWTEFWRRTSNW